MCRMRGVGLVCRVHAAWDLLPRAVPTICGAPAFQPVLLARGDDPPEPPAISPGGTHPPGPPLGETHPPRPPLSQARRAPDGAPAGQVRLELQGAADSALNLQLEGI